MSPSSGAGSTGASPATARHAGTPGDFVPRVEIMDAEALGRALRRMAHEIIERNDGTADLVLVGLQTGGVFLAERLAALLAEIDGADVPCGSLDVAMHRDDIGLRPVLVQAPTTISGDLTGRTVVLVDDVLYTGRTVRAALDAVCDFGRPRAVQLAVMVDRGHRELPIRADYVGKNLPTRREEMVDVSDRGVVLGVTV
ncbi:MAG: bifunctional pyr operon transcriptional regulator/uracil phosphoribosyltransferase PyrR [Acidimicrobiia bacterium]|nr:bifunctional pyr operon transcriptional regulator/uracil phosphoribosyltransferase PyrR [Acidimicrobiia bacterium]